MARPNSKQHGRHYSPRAAYRVNYAQNKLASPKVIGTSARYYDRAQQFRTSRHAANNLSTNTEHIVPYKVALKELLSKLAKTK